ncbi:GNAT family N-acetyltransferase [Aurantibacillus circumpalustris]|uniref:GNAT family N-acetyltransferase n=1 Tax=Aurantibacillus circumpalustris TaxID=3036359 RepID=UPI00295ADBF2|nr:GNAT family N-acetyltransferase [Aurantibacillus circumpalustris]
MEIKHEQLGKKGVFFVEENSSRIAELVYVFAGTDKFIIEHTKVNPGNEGKGLGRKLVDAAAAFARENSYKILPLCPYAKKVMQNSDIYQDILF